MSGSGPARASPMNDTFGPVRTPRLCLRRFADADAAQFAAYRADPEVARYQGWDAPYSLLKAQEFVAAMATADLDVPGEWIQIAVARGSDGHLIGDCAFSSRLDEPRVAEIGFTIDPAHQGRGYAREAARGLLGMLFDSLHKHRVMASCDPRNLASRKVLAAVGMRLEGHLVEGTWCKGEWTDDLVFAMLRREWLSTHNRHAS